MPPSKLPTGWVKLADGNYRDKQTGRVTAVDVTSIPTKRGWRVRLGPGGWVYTRGSTRQRIPNMEPPELMSEDEDELDRDREPPKRFHACHECNRVRVEQGPGGFIHTPCLDCGVSVYFTTRAAFLAYRDLYEQDTDEDEDDG